MQSPTAKAITRTRASERIGSALQSAAIGAESNSVNLSATTGAAVNHFVFVFHFRSPFREEFGAFIVSVSRFWLLSRTVGRSRIGWRRSGSARERLDQSWQVMNKAHFDAYSVIT